MVLESFQYFAGRGLEWMCYIVADHMIMVVDQKDKRGECSGRGGGGEKARRKMRWCWRCEGNNIPPKF
jgi:hypothetical protein